MLTAHSEHIAEIHLDGTNFPLIFSAPCQNKQAASRVLPCVSPDFARGDSYRRIPHTILRVLTLKLLDFQNWEKHSCLCHQEDRLAISRQVSHLLVGHLTVVCQAQVW